MEQQYLNNKGFTSVLKLVTMACCGETKESNTRSALWKQLIGPDAG